MINTIYHKSAISLSQQKSNRALIALLKGQLHTVDGYKIILGKFDFMRFLDYNDVKLATYIPSTKKLIIDLSELAINNKFISKYNKILKQFNLSCGLRDNKPWIKQRTGITYVYSFYNDVLTIDLRSTKECTRQSLWFMDYC